MGADHPAVARERKTAIRELSPGLPPGWFVEARVMNLAPVRTWGNPKGTGKLFVMELMDSSGGRTQAKAFNESAVRFGELVQFDHVYAIRGGSVRKANPDYASFTHQYELLLSQDTRVEELPNDDSIPHAEMAFVTIEDLVTRPLGSYVDLIAVVIDVGEVDCVVGRNDKVQTKRDILLVDTSNVQVLCTLWNEFSCLPVDGWLQKVIAIRRGRLTDFQGRSIGTTAKTSVMANPDFPDKRGVLEQWFQDDYNGQPLPIYLLVYTFTPVDGIYRAASDTVANVIAVVKSVGDGQDVQTLDGRALRKRDITLTDPSCMEIGCTLWGSHADRVNDTWSGHVAVITSARISDYNGRTISTRSISSVLLEPPIEQTERIAAWYRSAQSAPGITHVAPAQSQHHNRQEVFLSSGESGMPAPDTTGSSDLPRKGARRGKDSAAKAASTKRHRSQ